MTPISPVEVSRRITVNNIKHTNQISISDGETGWQDLSFKFLTGQPQCHVYTTYVENKGQAVSRPYTNLPKDPPEILFVKDESKKEPRKFSSKYDQTVFISVRWIPD